MSDIDVQTVGKDPTMMVKLNVILIVLNEFYLMVHWYQDIIKVSCHRSGGTKWKIPRHLSVDGPHGGTLDLLFLRVVV